jgi:hypothetical protein
MWLYVSDIGGALDVTVKDTLIVSDPNSLSARYRTDRRSSFTPKRYDAAGNELLLPLDKTADNQAAVWIAARSMVRAGVINELSRSATRLKTAFARVLYRESPTQVVFDRVRSEIRPWNGGVDAEHLRAHITEGMGLSGGFVCRDCTFVGGGRAFKAEAGDLNEIRFTCTEWDPAGVCTKNSVGWNIAAGTIEPMPLGNAPQAEPNEAFSYFHLDNIVFQRATFALAPNSKRDVPIFVLPGDTRSSAVYAPTVTPDTPISLKLGERFSR